MENKKQTPTIRMRSGDFDDILSVGAALSEMEVVGARMEQRFRAIPNGWRDLRCSVSLMSRLLDGLMETVPPEKRPSLARAARKMRFRSVIGPQAAANPTPEWVPILLDDLNVMTLAAREKCSVCMDWRCDRCPLGKALDHMLRYDRNGQSWAAISDEMLVKFSTEEEGKK